MGSRHAGRIDAPAAARWSRSGFAAGDALSWYEATSCGRRSYAPLDGGASHDVIVVGGGFTGLTVALELAQRGIDVALVEAKRIGWGASGRNGGQVVTGFVKSMSEIRELAGSDCARRLWDMSEEGKRLVQERIARFSIPCDYRPGYMYTAVKARHELWLRGLLREWTEDYGYAGARWLDRGETRALVDCPYYRGGIFDSENGHLHPLNYALGLARAAAEAGAAIHERTPVTRLVAGSKVRLETPKGELSADFVVLAGNALLGPISPEIADRVRPQIVPVATYMIATEPMSPEQAREIIPGGIAVSDVMFVVNYFSRTPDHRLLFGGGLDWSGSTVRNASERMRRTMGRWLPGARGLKAEYCWGGLVDMTLNRLPSLGRIGTNVFYVHGFSGNGITLTGIAGRVTAEAVAGTASRFDVFARLPHRAFPGGSLLRHPIAVLGALWYKLKDLLP